MCCVDANLLPSSCWWSTCWLLAGVNHPRLQRIHDQSEQASNFNSVCKSKFGQRIPFSFPGSTTTLSNFHSRALCNAFNILTVHVRGCCDTETLGFWEWLETCEQRSQVSVSRSGAGIHRSSSVIHGAPTEIHACWFVPSAPSFKRKVRYWKTCALWAPGIWEYRVKYPRPEMENGAQRWPWVSVSRGWGTIYNLQRQPGWLLVAGILAILL